MLGGHTWSLDYTSYDPSGVPTSLVREIAISTWNLAGYTSLSNPACVIFYVVCRNGKETNKVFDIGKGVIEMEVNKAWDIC